MEQKSTFDENRALAELEQLLQAIEAARRQRVQASDRLEAFVREVRTRDRQQTDRRHTSDSATSDPLPGGKETATFEPPVPVRSVEAETASSTTDVLRGAAAANSAAPIASGSPGSGAREPAAGAIEEPAAGAKSARRARTLLNWRRLLTTGGVVLAIAAAIVAGRALRGRAPEPVLPAASPPPPAAVVAEPPPAPAAAVEGELTAVRRVWVRITADGSRVVERELDAGTRVPLRASRALVLRIGDAGAVHLTINGREQTLGGDGQVVTLTYPAVR